MHIGRRSQDCMAFRQHKVNVVRHDDTGLHTKQAIRQIQTTYFLLHDTSLRRRLPRPVTDMPQEAGVISYAECHEIIPIRTIIKMAEPHGATLKFRIFHLTKISVSPDMPATATVYLQKYTTTGPGGTPVAAGFHLRAFHCAVPAPGVTSGAPTGFPQSAHVGATFMSPG